MNLNAKDGMLVAQGTKVGFNLYKMKVPVYKPITELPKTMNVNPQIFFVNEPVQS